MATWSPAADERVGIPAAVFLTLNQEPVRWLADLRSQGSMIVAGLAFDEHNGWDPSVLDSLVDIDILVCNATEAMAYTRTPDVEQALTALAQRAPLVVVTMGADGAIARGRLPGDRGDVAGVQHQPAVPAQAVDATGAGDSYVSALIDAALRPDASLTECLKHASLVAAFVVAGRGGAASAPTPQQLLRRAQQLGATFDFERTWSTLRSSRSL
jgi:sugar/nucleoside kinase (ribokinase family)